MPSAQEGRFRFGDRVIATDSKRVGIVIDTLRYEGSLVYYAVAFDSGVTYHLGPDQLEPADSHGRVVAQQGWRERVDEAISQLEDAYADYARTLSDACYARVERQREVVGALLDEVIELPKPPKIPLVLYSEIGQRWNLTTNHLNTDRGLLLMASALIAAAREGKAK